MGEGKWEGEETERLVDKNRRGRDIERERESASAGGKCGMRGEGEGGRT